jgi:hypothetical protein
VEVNGMLVVVGMVIVVVEVSAVSIIISSSA